MSSSGISRRASSCSPWFQARRTAYSSSVKPAFSISLRYLPGVAASMGTGGKELIQGVGPRLGHHYVVHEVVLLERLKGQRDTGGNVLYQ